MIIGERLSCETKILMEISRECGLSASVKTALSLCPGKAIERIESERYSIFSRNWLYLLTSSGETQLKWKVNQV